MLYYNIDELETSLKSPNNIVAIHGAGLRGRLVLYAFAKRGINVDFFVDNDKQKQNKLYCNIKTISAEEFSKIGLNSHLFISHDYIIPIMEELKKLNFKNYYNTVDLLEKTNFSNGNEYTKKYPNWTPLKMERYLKNHKYAADKAARVFSKVGCDVFNIKHIDIVVTERCSMKCKHCSNLMQYYARPQNIDLNILFKSLDRMMQSVDQIYEFRVIGGDPFMNKEMYKVVNKLTNYQNVETIVIYTNAKIVPKGENLECLKNKKVRLEITNYGFSAAKETWEYLNAKHDEIISLLDAHNIAYQTDPVKLWDDIGLIKYEKKTHKQLNKLFADCCAKDLFTLLHGTLYKCPVSAHGTNLKAIPFDEKYDGIDLTNEDISIKELRKKLQNFCDNEKYVTACNYCKGRGYGYGTIKAGIQTKKPLPINRIPN